jgi:hypothetical protein
VHDPDVVQEDEERLDAARTVDQACDQQPVADGLQPARGRTVVTAQAQQEVSDRLQQSRDDQRVERLDLAPGVLPGAPQLHEHGEREDAAEGGQPDGERADGPGGGRPLAHRTT